MTRVATALTSPRLSMYSLHELMFILPRLLRMAILSTTRLSQKYVHSECSEILANHHFQAFNHALDDWNVDIVIMSFGYHVRGLYRLFEEALSRARKFWPKKDVLLFAAASNEGGNSPRTYPARFDNVFCINSCDGNGDGSGFNPTPVEKEDNYCILGQDILAADPKVRVSGTSYAAPIAASLAASLIEFVGQNWPHADLVRGMQVMEDLQTHSGMRRILDGIAKKRNDYYYLCPWQELFNIESNPSNEEICRNIFKIVLC